MDEYKVIMLDPAPDDAEEQLAELVAQRWEVVCSYYEDRIILKREKINT